MAGGRPATNRVLPNASKQALVDENTRRGVSVSFVYLVVAQAAYEPGSLTPLGAFAEESRAQAFIDFAPSPQRGCLGIQKWEINQPTCDPFWTGTENGLYLNAPRPNLDEPKTSNTPPLDPAFLRFREKLLLCGNDGHRDAFT